MTENRPKGPVHSVPTVQIRCGDRLCPADTDCCIFDAVGALVDAKLAFHPAQPATRLSERRALQWLREHGGELEFRTPDPANEHWTPFRVRVRHGDRVIIADGHTFGDVVAAICADATARVLARETAEELTA